MSEVPLPSSTPGTSDRCRHRTGEHTWMANAKYAGSVTCTTCGIDRKDVRFIKVAGCDVQASSEFGLYLQKAREEGGFHWRNDIFFKRQPDGSVRLRHFYEWNSHPNFADWVIPATEWASIVCSVSSAGETLERWNEAQDFHGR